MTFSDYLTIAEVTGDQVVYRNLQPCDSSLPGRADLCARLGLPSDALPRKRDADYARLIFELLTQMQARRSTRPVQVVLVVGDTDNDRQMIAHLRTVTGLPVFGFIGTDRAEDEPGYTWDSDTATATRWALLDDWRKLTGWRYAPENGELPWAQTAVLLDIDKTLLGPRGRSDEQINAARAEAAYRLAQVLLGNDIAEQAFFTLYNTLCRSEFESLTLDNQDYIVYIALLMASGALPVDELVDGINNASLTSFSLLLNMVEARLPQSMQSLHTEIRAAHNSGDPTPFKAFRRTEFAATAVRMVSGQLTLCRELMALSRWMVEQGALCMAASDKPAESALPTPEHEEAGFLPLHRTPAKME